MKLEEITIKDPYGFIYITTNMINGKRYVGQRCFDIKEKYRKYLGSGTVFKMALMKYGKENFKKEIVDIAYSKDEINQKEILWINELNCVSDDNYYNLSYGGEGFACGEKNEMFGINVWDMFSEDKKIELREKMKKRNMGEGNPMYGVSVKDRMSDDGYIEWRRKRFYLSKGENNPNYGSHTLKDKYAENPELRKLLSRPASQNGRAIKVICLTTNKPFDYIGEATEKYNLKNRWSITLCCRGEKKFYGKLPDGTPLRWMYYEDYLKLHNETNETETVNEVIEVK